jgi:hypothetical protein
MRAADGARGSGFNCASLSILWRTGGRRECVLYLMRSPAAISAGVEGGSCSCSEYKDRFIRICSRFFGNGFAGGVLYILWRETGARDQVLHRVRTAGARQLHTSF